jgi:hypothetical protein
MRSCQLRRASSRLLQQCHLRPRACSATPRARSPWF